MGCGASTPQPSERIGLEPLPPIERHRSGSVVSGEIEPTNARRQATKAAEIFQGVRAHQLGTYSSHGIKPGHNGAAFAKINQDRGLITYPFAGDASMAFFGVFDGHGSNGEQVSDYIMWKVQELLLKEKNLPETMEACLIRAFEQADEELAASSVSAKVSGTAAVVCVLHGKTLWVANAGDSRAVLAYRGERGIVVRALTVDQKPDNPGEEARILRCGGFVSQASAQYGPPRVWVRQGEGPGLAMARSLGDHVCKPVGVIATPEVTRYEIDPSKDTRLCLASDGVWEFIENEQAMDIVMRQPSAPEACAALIDESARRWRDAEGNYRDDITAIVAHLPFFPTTSTATTNGSTAAPPPPSAKHHEVRPQQNGMSHEALPVVNGVAADSGKPLNEAPSLKRRLTVHGEMDEAQAANGMAELRAKYGQ